jgi:3-oxoisoapionate decarboxylase
MKLGINSYTFMWSIGFDGARPDQPMSGMDLLEKACQLGIKLVQTGPNLPMDTYSTLEFIAQAQRYGIELEFGTRGLETDILLHWINICRRANAKLLRTVPEINGQDPTVDELVLALNQIKPQLVKNKIKLGIENSRIPCRDLRKAIEETGCPWIGVVLDMVNSLAVPEGWKEVTQVLAPHTMCLHYKDFSIQRTWHRMGFHCEGRPAGQGQLEAEWLFHSLEQSQHRFNVILELWTPEQNTLPETIALEHKWAEVSIRFLRQYIPE